MYDLNIRIYSFLRRLADLEQSDPFEIVRAMNSSVHLLADLCVQLQWPWMVYSDFFEKLHCELTLPTTDRGLACDISSNYSAQQQKWRSWTDHWLGTHPEHQYGLDVRQPGMICRNLGRSFWNRDWVCVPRPDGCFTAVDGGSLPQWC